MIQELLTLLKILRLVSLDLGLDIDLGSVDLHLGLVGLDFQKDKQTTELP